MMNDSMKSRFLPAVAVRLLGDIPKMIEETRAAFAPMTSAIISSRPRWKAART